MENIIKHNIEPTANRRIQSLRLFSPLTNEDGSGKMPMLAALALIDFLALGGLILAATCNSNYSNSYCHTPAPLKLIRITCFFQDIWACADMLHTSECGYLP